MDEHRFDSLARALAPAATRRDLVRSVVAGGIGMLMGGRARLAGAKPQTYSLCHATGSSTHPWEVITVPQAAVNAHIDHGDQFFVECCSNADCDDGDPCTYDVCGPLTRVCYHDPIPNCSPCGDACGGGTCCDGRCCPEGSVCMTDAAGRETCCDPCGDTFCCDQYTSEGILARNCVEGCGFCCNGGNGECTRNDAGEIIEVSCVLPGNSR